MVGTADQVGNVEAAQVLVQEIDRAEFYAFEGRCHALWVTAATEFCEVLRSFLTDGIGAGGASFRLRAPGLIE